MLPLFKTHFKKNFKLSLAILCDSKAVSSGRDIFKKYNRQKTYFIPSHDFNKLKNNVQKPLALFLQFY